MAVAISNGDVNLTTASGFDEAENYNLGMFSTTDLVLSSTRTIAFTPATARNSKGVILALTPSTSLIDRNVTVDLQENVASVWTTRQTVTLTYAQIANSASNETGHWIVLFDYTDHAVTAAASTWRFQISQASGATGNWNLRTSDATNPFYVEIPDKPYTFVTNDVLIQRPGDTVTFDAAAATFKGVLGTGDSANAVACVLGRCANPPTVANSETGLAWDTSASRTLTIDGMMILGAHSCIRIGSSASPVTFANQAILSFTNRTVGTTVSGLYDCEGANSAFAAKPSIFFYGATPTVRSAELNADTTIGGTTFTTATNVSSWANGWRVFVSKQTVKGLGDVALYTLNGSPSWNGSQSTITTTVGLATNVRRSGGKIVVLDGYGIKIVGTATNRAQLALRGPSNVVVEGVQVEEIQGFGLNTSTNLSVDDAANRSQIIFKNCTFYNTAANLSSALIVSLAIPIDGCLVDGVYAMRAAPVSGTQFVGGSSGVLTVRDCIAQSMPGLIWTTTPNSDIQRNVFENGNGNTIRLNGANVTWKDNEVWGNSATLGAVTWAFSGALANSNDFSGNSYNNNNIAVVLGVGVTINVIENNASFGTETANTTDIDFTVDCLSQCEFNSPTGNLTISETNLALSTPGTHLRISDYNDTTNDDRNWLTYGKIVRTGPGLSDTTVRTAGGYAVRFEPDDDGVGTNLLTFEQNVPTGDIEDLTMSVSVWVYINNTAYDAGTYVMPTLRVTYDNGTDVTAVATATFGSWQRLSVNFTPATGFGQITISLEAATTATGSNAYVYWDDFSINYPPGIAPDLSGMDLWANAMPITPSIALINADAGSVWDALLSDHMIQGSFGQQVQTSDMDDIR